MQTLRGFSEGVVTCPDLHETFEVFVLTLAPVACNEPERIRARSSIKLVLIAHLQQSHYLRMFNIRLHGLQAYLELASEVLDEG